MSRGTLAQKVASTRRQPSPADTAPDLGTEDGSSRTERHSLSDQASPPRSAPHSRETPEPDDYDIERVDDDGYEQCPHCRERKLKTYAGTGFRYCLNCGLILPEQPRELARKISP